MISLICLLLCQNQLSIYQSYSKMLNETIFSAFSFGVAGLQVSCGMDQGLLKIKVTTSENMKPAQLYLSKIISEGSIELWIAQIQHSSASKDTQPFLKSLSSQQYILPKLQQRLNGLEMTIRQLQDRIINRTQSRRQLMKSSSSDIRFSGSPSRSNPTTLPSVAIREMGETMFTAIIQEEVEQKAKLQLLNGLLQEKILEKQTFCLQVEKRLADREELIRELAEKLIIANIEKEEISNEYEKILQNNVFHRLDEQPFKFYQHLSAEPSHKDQNPPNMPFYSIIDDPSESFEPNIVQQTMEIEKITTDETAKTGQ